MPYTSDLDKSRYARDHYVRNSADYKRRAAAHKIVARDRNRRFVWSYLRLHPCVDCGESDPVVLEFDHRDKEAKHKEISRMVNGGSGILAIRREIEKCDVRCANCHRRRTAKQFGWIVPADCTERTLF